MLFRSKNGFVSILPKALKVDENFFKQKEANKTPIESQFRFANTCLQSGCLQWTGKKCGVAIRAIHLSDKSEFGLPLQDCSIRLQCRWYAQEGESICSICPKIVTHISAKEVDDYFENLNK